MSSEKAQKSLAIVMPAYNEEKVIGKTIASLKKHGYTKIIVIDDGSADRTRAVAEKAGAIVFSHPINRGLGGALGTGIAAALDSDAEIIVTFDSDGQHDPTDIKRLIRPILARKADVVIGSRLKNPKGMPVIRRIGNWGFNIITYMLFGVWTTDSQSGLRAFSRSAAEKIEIKTNRMEVSSEIIKEIGRTRLRFTEVPIRAIYTDYSKRHGQSSWNAFRILAKLVLRKLMR
ncbi:glycosyltransferase family 2 protein [Candidatus Woesearchaeota archaeon]|nr:glycosyltransferase family 2 protein [Candidatus Woesearchaeota archaeon]